MRLIPLWCGFFSLLVPLNGAFAGGLDGLGDATDSGDDGSDEETAGCFMYCFDDAADDDNWGSDDPDVPSCPRYSLYYAAHPYAGEGNGRTVIVENEPMVVHPEKRNRRGQIVSPKTSVCPGRTDPPSSAQAAAFKLGLDYVYDVGGVHIPEGSLMIDVGRYSLRTRIKYLLEPLADGVDQLLSGDANIYFRMGHTEFVEARVGIGVRFLADFPNRGGEAGVNGSFSLDLFPLSPLVISLDLDVGSLGASLYAEGRLLLGVVLGAVEFHGGYNAIMVLANGTTSWLHGPGVGIRFWF